jgi:hypothetical protein
MQRHPGVAVFVAVTTIRGGLFVLLGSDLAEQYKLLAVGCMCVMAAAAAEAYEHRTQLQQCWCNQHASLQQLLLNLPVCLALIVTVLHLSLRRQGALCWRAVDSPGGCATGHDLPRCSRTGKRWVRYIGTVQQYRTSGPSTAAAVPSYILVTSCMRMEPH